MPGRPTTNASIPSKAKMAIPVTSRTNVTNAPNNPQNDIESSSMSIDTFHNVMSSKGLSYLSSLNIVNYNDDDGTNKSSTDEDFNSKSSSAWSHDQAYYKSHICQEYVHNPRNSRI